MSKRDLVVASTRHQLARLLKYYPRRPCAPSLIKSRFFSHTYDNNFSYSTYFLTFFKFLICIHAGNPGVPPRVLAPGRRPKPCGGKNAPSALLSYISTREFLRTREKCGEARAERECFSHFSSVLKNSRMLI